MHALPVLLTLGRTCLTIAVDDGSNKPKMITNFSGVADAGNANFTGIDHTGHTCFASAVGTGKAHWNS
jgi:hypothetical protein